MKNNRFFLATVLALSLGACSTDVTAPGSRAPATASASIAPTDSTPPPPAPTPAEVPTDGIIGSGMGK